MSSTNRQKLRQIVVLGGGGFLVETRKSRLDNYVLNLTRKRSPRVCFVPTASGDSPEFIERFYRAFGKFDCRPTHLPLFQRSAVDPAKHLLSQDVIYVGGGNTANMLAIWKLHGIDRAMHLAWNRGIILCGVSAGMNCWFESSVTDSFGPLQELNAGLGLLAGSACPHYSGDADRRPTYHRLIRSKHLPAGVAADDGAAIHFVNRTILRCVRAIPKANAYRVSMSAKEVVEKAFNTRLLSLGGSSVREQAERDD